jgi:predicted dinucleotide-binding enzyme
MRIGIVGAGMIGSTVAKLWVEAGHEVRLASRHPEELNTVYFKVLEREAHRQGDRVGIPLAGDDREAVETAARLVRDAGFDPVIVGGLARGKAFEPDTPTYNTGMSGRELRTVLGSDTEAAA